MIPSAVSRDKIERVPALMVPATDEEIAGPVMDDNREWSSAVMVSPEG